MQPHPRRRRRFRAFRVEKKGTDCGMTGRDGAALRCRRRCWVRPAGLTRKARKPASRDAERVSKKSFGQSNRYTVVRQIAVVESEGEFSQPLPRRRRRFRAFRVEKKGTDCGMTVGDGAALRCRRRCWARPAGLTRKARKPASRDAERVGNERPSGNPTASVSGFLAF